MAQSPNAEIVTPDAAAIAEFKAIADEYAKTWVEENTSDNFDAQAYYDKVLGFVAKYPY